MNDCPNADVRDLLPDLVHGRLDAESRAMVEAHVAACADCRAELALLRDLRASLGRTPRLDLAAITAAVPAYRAPARRSWVGWRTAAAITVLVAGGSSVVVLRRTPEPRGDTVVVVSPPARGASAPASAPAQVSVPVPAPITSAPRATAQATAHATTPPVVSQTPAPTTQVVQVPERGGRELAMGGGSLNDLNDRQLTSLLKDIESLDAVPSVEVDNTPIAPIAPDAPRRTSP
jgi:anti-sigma factor RsiW